MNVTIYDKLTQFPQFISIETRMACNSRCTFCPHSLTDRNEKNESIEEKIFQKVIKECSQYDDLKQLTLSFQNEPLLDRKIFEKIGYAKRITNNKPKICIVTNAALLTKDRVEELIKNPPNILKISVYGITKEIYESGMLGLDFNRTIENIDYLVSKTKNIEDFEIQINTLYTDEISRIGYENLKVYWQNKGLKLHLINVENRAGKLYENMKSFSENNWRIRNWCQRPMKQLSVLTTGEVVLCCAIWNKELIVGNVNENTLYEIWNSELMNYYRDNLKNGNIENLFPCNHCMQADIVIDGYNVIEYKKFQGE